MNSKCSSPSTRKSSRIRVISTAAFSFLLSLTLNVWADSDPNQLIAFKRLYVEPATDNVDGVFRAPVEESFKEVFDRNPRFELVSSKDDADSVLRTKLEKKTSGIDVEISMIVRETGEVYSTDRATVPPQLSGKETGEYVKQLLKTTLKKIPFYGTATGRDGNELTFDIGTAHGLKRGDIVQISRVDQVKRHPLLKSIVDVQLVPVGTAQIDQVEEHIAFGHVNTEIPGEKIQKLYKVTAIEARAPEFKEKKKKTGWNNGEFIVEEDEKDPNRPQLGYVGLGILMSSFSSTTSINNNATSFSGSAFNPGFRLNGELWITKRWFADMLIGYSTMSFRQVNTSTTTELDGLSASSSNFGLNVGYKYLPNDSLYGPVVQMKLGYYNFSWNTPTNAAELLSSKSYSALNLGIGGQMPVSSQDMGVLLNVNVLLFPSISEEGYKTGSEGSATGATFYVGGYYYLSNKVSLRAGFQFETYSADFLTNDSKSSTGQKVIGFLPSLQYYF